MRTVYRDRKELESPQEMPFERGAFQPSREKRNQAISSFRLVSHAGAARSDMSVRAT